MSSPLHTAEQNAGATFDPAADRVLPLRFGQVGEEWTAVRRRCGLLDAGFRSVLRLNGGDRTTFLQGMLTNDVAKLAEGTGTYAALLTIQGRVVSDLRLYVLAEEIWLDVPAAREASVRESLERYIIADDVEFATGDEWTPLLVLEGPHAARVLLAVVGESVGDLPPFAQRAVVFDDLSLRVVAATHSGEVGYLVYGPAACGATLWERCRAAGAEPVGMEALNVLRVEAGIPWTGIDMDDTTLVSEVGLEAAISFSKGCYLGQEVVERVAARGQVQRKLVGLLCDGRALPGHEATIRHAAKDVGHVTSAVWSPAREAVIGLGYARREAWSVGTVVEIVGSSGTIGAQVAALPFYPTPS